MSKKAMRLSNSGANTTELKEVTEHGDLKVRSNYSDSAKTSN